MTILKICFCFMALFSCSNVNKDDIVVIGQASNGKAGALVISSSDSIKYYVAGLDS